MLSRGYDIVVQAASNDNSVGDAGNLLQHCPKVWGNGFFPSTWQ